MREVQAVRILAVLTAAERDFMVVHTPVGVRVETEAFNGQDGYECEGRNLVDALAQLGTVLACELGTVDAPDWLHDAEVDGGGDIDEPMRYALEAPVEFCPLALEVKEPGWREVGT